MVERMASTSLYERAEHATRIIRARTTVEPRIAVVLGSGLGGFADDFEDAVGIPYEDIPGFVRSTAQGHAGRLVIGKIDGIPVLAMQGRVHYYEGYSLEEVTFPVRTFQFARYQDSGADECSGRDKCALTQGALMVISDHLNLMGVNPLAWTKRRTIWTTLSGYVGGLLSRSCRNWLSTKRKRSAWKCGVEYMAH